MPNQNEKEIKNLIVLVCLLICALGCYAFIASLLKQVLGFLSFGGVIVLFYILHKLLNRLQSSQIVRSEEIGVVI